MVEICDVKGCNERAIESVSNVPCYKEMVVHGGFTKRICKNHWNQIKNSVKWK